AALAGGPGALAERALALVDTVGGSDARAGAGSDAVEDSLRLAAHLAELATLAAPEDPGMHRARARVFSTWAATASSTMAKGVFNWAARQSQDEATQGH
ncbi:MAG: alkyl sulfatase dimerization domain-containing protein, partial [Acidimicrobiales bacterium]